jgi:phage terminase large subunit
MNVNFHKKYEPLFELLEGRYPEVSIVLISGGRDSGKSFALGCFQPIAAAKYNHRVVSTRQTMASTSNSIAESMAGKMKLLSLDTSFSFANNLYRSKHNQGKILISGLKSSTGQEDSKMKSLEDFSIFYCDEASEIPTFEDWEKVSLSIRAQDVRTLSILSFNPPTKQHWLYEKFYTGIPDGFCGVVGNVMYIHTDYRDNDYVTKENAAKYLIAKEPYDLYLATNDEKYLKGYNNYRNKLLGYFKSAVEGVIFDYTIGEFDDTLPFVFGGDQGVTHPCTIIKTAVDKKNKKIYLDEVFYRTGCSTNEVYNSIAPEVGKGLIVMDNAAPLFILDLTRLGLKIIPCYKEKIVDRIRKVQNYEIIVTARSKNLAEELDNYAWLDTSKRASEREVPIDKWNHGIDASLGYAVTFLTQQSSSIF